MNMQPNITTNMKYSWKKAGKLPMLLLTLFLLTACQKTNVSPTPNTKIINIQVTIVSTHPLPTKEPYIFKTSQPGTATLHGNLVVIDPSTLPAKDDPIYLVPINQDSPVVLAIPQFTKGKIPQADVDERTGEFMFTNIKVGRYVVVVVTIDGAQIPARTMDESHNLVIVRVDETFLDKITNIGTMNLP
jgi:hypothetical protein